ncbi:at hook domain-containing protein [Fusarium sporotrichioides]|uniref:At hook domain-containing protein n=1 Tax=Fusarium sporotrichioides TaxID=5514 RepID=A0A395RMX3_FUSSP|nr:at hook domain-containing protein [Fusarium sporotrichioides]
MSAIIHPTSSSPNITTRQTRSSTRQALSSIASPSKRDQSPESSSKKPQIGLIPSDTFISRIPLPSEDRDILVSKRDWLTSHTVSLPQDVLQSVNLNPTTYFNPVGATYVFAQAHAGTAVCISPDGVLLTCAHCIADKPSELTTKPWHVLISSSGNIVFTKVISWDPVRDLALLLIDRAQSTHRPFPHIRIASSPPNFNSKLLCVGHPGSDDLEAEDSDAETGYDTLVLSEGAFRGLAEDQDPQDNSGIGALRHNCWTYWGHSGAGLFDRTTGSLVGVHSSWDEKTGMRRGVPLEAVVAFLEEFEISRREAFGKGWRWYVQ